MQGFLRGALGRPRARGGRAPPLPKRYEVPRMCIRSRRRMHTPHIPTAAESCLGAGLSRLSPLAPQTVLGSKAPRPGSAVPEAVSASASMRLSQFDAGSHRPTGATLRQRDPARDGGSPPPRFPHRRPSRCIAVPLGQGRTSRIHSQRVIGVARQYGARPPD